MEDEKKLYPMKFCVLEDRYNWGTDAFSLADLGYRDTFIRDGWLATNTLSEVMDMYMDRVVGEDIFAGYGRQFPFQVKNITVNGKMPLRVHPADETASQRYDLLGREKLWYIRSAGKDACIMKGFNRDVDASEVYSACVDGSVEKLLNVIPVKAGEFWYIAPGTVHAACGQLSIVEISESSPLDFCLCGWGETVSSEEFDENLNLVDALDFIDYRKASAAPVIVGSGAMEKVLSLPQFTVTRLRLDNPVKVTSERFDSCMCYTCVGGDAAVQCAVPGIGEVDYALKAGETILVPSDVESFVLLPKAASTVLLETIVEHKDAADPYINPDAPAEPAE